MEAAVLYAESVTTLCLFTIRGGVVIVADAGCTGFAREWDVRVEAARKSGRRDQEEYMVAG